jgi:hypothetical protein
MKLCKESGNQEFMFWAAVAMNFQVPQGAVGPSPVLNIAEMMMKKAVDAVRPEKFHFLPFVWLPGIGEPSRLLPVLIGCSPFGGAKFIVPYHGTPGKGDVQLNVSCVCV